MNTLERVPIVLGTVLIVTVIWSVGQLEGGSVELIEFEITNDAADPFTCLNIELMNEDQRPITRIRARINEIELPYTFNVSRDNPVQPSRRAEFHRYTAWFVPGGGVDGYCPVDGEDYKLRLTIDFSDGFTQTITKYGRFKERKIASIRSIGGFEMLFFDKADLLTFVEGSSLYIQLRNVWYLGDSQTLKRLELHVDDEKIFDESIRIKFGEYYAVTVSTPTRFESRQYYNVTLVAYSIEGNTSTYSRKVLCQEK
ncbi:hypothetical protein GF326_01700 [Candidatus Bathyarchaeota archaeon]|nr:hypothetical protein [Candidatus Bathyarchaeota archaeon]